MKIITAKQARTMINHGAWIDGQSTSGARWPDDDHYWVLTDPATMSTYHVRVDDMPHGK